MPVNPVNSAQTDLADCRRMILFGGTFDPPQVAHVEMPRRAREAIGGANVIAYVPAAISRFLRSTTTGKAYWFGNITGPEAYASAPRYPLVMGEVSDETGLLKRGTIAVVDDRNPEEDSEALQLSNFSLLEDRETQDIELYMTRFGARPDDMWRSDAYMYRIVPE